MITPKLTKSNATNHEKAAAITRTDHFKILFDSISEKGQYHQPIAKFSPLVEEDVDLEIVYFL